MYSQISNKWVFVVNQSETYLHMYDNQVIKMLDIGCI